MGWVIIWILFGLIGYTIGIKKGYDPVIALVSGLILGIFSPLMLLFTSKVKKCPQCAESVKKEAKICRFCGYKFLQQ